MIFPEFKDVIATSDLTKDVQERLLLAIEKLNTQEQVLLLQLFQKYPEKIEAFWEVSQKKFAYLKNGVGNLDTILEEEIELFS